MKTEWLNSPTDGCTASNTNNVVNKTMYINAVPQTIQYLSGPDVAINNFNQGTQPYTPQKDCGCGGAKPLSQPPYGNTQPAAVNQAIAKQQAVVAQGRLNDIVGQAKNYYNKVSAKYPQQGQPQMNK